MEMTTRRWVLLGIAVFAGVVMCAGGIGALVYGGYSMVTGGDAFLAAEAHAKASPELQAQVGPVSEVAIDWQGGTSVQQSSDNGVSTGSARYSLRVKGPRGEVPACVVLSLNGEKWTVEGFAAGQPCSKMPLAPPAVET